ncbi:MAG: sulfotransferase, partial [Chloroflexota bacterium]
MALYLTQYYPEAVRKIVTDDALETVIRKSTITEDSIAKLQQTVETNRQVIPAAGHTSDKNPSAIFILCPPRSGSTLFRVMLAGHPSLFAPPELDLLTFETLQMRRSTMTDGDSFRLAGAIRAIMASHNCNAEKAIEIINQYVAESTNSLNFYGQLQQWVAPKRLVDKSTFYPLDLEILKRIEQNFDQPLYLHLHRHPYGMIHSFEKARADRLYFKEQAEFSVQEIGELTWLIAHQNILNFLQDVPTHRQHTVKFEDLVHHPEATMTNVCHFLGIELHPAMLQPYQDDKTRMTDGIHENSASRMIGDVKFHEHQQINPDVADRWRNDYTTDFLSDLGWQLAHSFGYKRDISDNTLDTQLSSPIIDTIQ